MRLVDADALKDNMFHYAAPEMVWDRGDIEHKINEMPTIDAIPMDWMDAQIRGYASTLKSTELKALVLVKQMWEKEQEAHGT